MVGDVRNIEGDEDESSEFLGTANDNIQTGEQGNTCGILYCKDRSKGTTLKQSTYQFQGGVSPQVPVQISRT